MSSPHPGECPVRRGKKCCGASGAGGGGAFKDFVDKVTEMGTKVGHSATVWGGELMNTVHRDEGGNSVTLSKMEVPTTGEGGAMRGNVLSLSKMGRNADAGRVANNVLTASKFSHGGDGWEVCAVRCEREAR